MQLTDEQMNAVDLFKKARSLKISAFAGTGKTSTLTALAKASSKHGLYLAFNRSVADEAAAKFPKAVDCKTTHKLALNGIPSEYRQTEGKLFENVNGNRVAQLLEFEEIAVGDVTLKPRSLAYLTARTVQRFCQSGDESVTAHHVPLTGKLQKIDRRYQQEFGTYVGELAAHLWDIMRDPASPAPLGHDGYLKLWSLSQPMLDYDYILLDEAQDTNEAVLSVLRQQQTQLTLVGDRHQQIYEWRGAVNAMASLDTEAEAVLTRSFRFGDTVASAATSILRVLHEPRSVIGDPTKRTRIAGAGSTRTTLCRTNAGVVGVVVDALNESRRPHVVGGVKELVAMLQDVERLKRSIPALSPELFGFENWYELVEFAESEEGKSLRSFVKIVLAHGETKLIGMLNSLPKEELGADLIVSTGHKAKGREWDSVTLHSDFDPRVDKVDPKKMVMSPDEARLLYVAATRARELLVVPPRLAERWNAETSPAIAVPKTSHRTPEVDSIKVAPVPRPVLPSFAKVVAKEKSSPGDKTAQTEGSGRSPSAVASTSGATKSIQQPAPRDVQNNTSVSKAAGGILAALVTLIIGS